jgi:hypothetical protein
MPVATTRPFEARTSRQALENARGHISHGARIRASDGTPLPKKWVDHENGVVKDNWGKPLYPLTGQNPQLNYTDHPVAKYVGRFATKLFCGKECSSASAPANADQAAQAPKQLSDVKIARNAVSQAIAAKALRRWIGKIGVFIDEGVDGMVDRLMPEPLGMAEKSPIHRLRTEARYASAVRTARSHETWAKVTMLKLHVHATQKAKDFQEAKAAGVRWAELARLQGIQDAAELMYMDGKKEWYDAVDDLDAKTRLFENYIKFGQYEVDGRIAPDPEVDGTDNLDPDAY